ncbi:MAG: GNAT family N-acetyltransferase [Bacteroidetes bacterium]|nr:GNAT family N-acetyltransferase [Bacteroidota bacterium]
MNNEKKHLTFHPLTSQNWKHFETLFGAKGACGGCWCMTWRLTSKDYEKFKGNGNKQKIRRLVKSNRPLGIIAFKNKIPIGWCSVSPRHTFPRLENSKLLKRLDDIPVWSITCLFINKEFRRKNISSFLIKEAAEYAFQNGATVVEAYPVIPKKKPMPDVFAWTGIANAYKKVGFAIAHQPNENRLIMRKIKNK